MPATSDGRHKRNTRLRTNWANILSSGYWCNNFPSSSQCVLFPWDIESRIVRFPIGSLIALSNQFDRELFRLHVDTNDMVIDEIAVGNRVGIIETLADGIDNECFHLGRWDSANGPGTFGLSLDQRLICCQQKTQAAGASA